MCLSEGYMPLLTDHVPLQWAAISADVGSERQQKNNMEGFHVLVDRWQPKDIIIIIDFNIIFVFFVITTITILILVTIPP